MRSKPGSIALGALAGLALTTAAAFAVTPASPGQLVGQPQKYDGQEVSVTGWVSIRGNVGWLQLCDSANSCIYLRPSDDYQGPPLRAKEGQRLTFVGRFHSLGVVNHTDVQNVLEVQG
jgi:hypothetical protein